MGGVGRFARRLRDRNDDHLPLAAGPVSNGEFVPAAPTAHDRAVNAVIRESIDDASRRTGVGRRRFLQGAGAVAASLGALELAGARRVHASGRPATRAGTSRCRHRKTRLRARTR